MTGAWLHTSQLLPRNTKRTWGGDDCVLIREALRRRLSHKEWKENGSIIERRKEGQKGGVREGGKERKDKGERRGKKQRGERGGGGGREER